MNDNRDTKNFATMTPFIFYPEQLKQKYHEFMYLAMYYRWSAAKFGCTGHRSPIDGKQYTLRHSKDHDAPYRAAGKAMARVYLQQARAVREEWQRQLGERRKANF